MTKERKAELIVKGIAGYAAWGDWNGVPRLEIESRIADGLEEYARQQSIAFSKYMFEYVWKMNSMNPSMYISDEEFYNKFTEQQQNKQ